MAGKIEPRYGVEVYPNEDGEVVIKQVRPMGEDQHIFLHPEEASRLISLLQEELEQLGGGEYWI